MKRLFLCSLALLLGGCANSDLPPCPHEGKPDFAPSAGCLAVVHGSVLLVETLHGKASPPGGRVRAGESAQCAAHRETFEETGLDLLPAELLAVFDTGFHLYHCQIHAASRQINPDKLEVRKGFWLPVTEFDSVQWRFPGQGEAIRSILMPGQNEKD